MKKISQIFSYALIAIIFGIVVLVFSLWLPNLSLIKANILSDVPIAEKIRYVWISLLIFNTGLSGFSQVFTVAISLLFGINVSLTIFYIRRRARVSREAGVSVLGTIVGLLGVGCSACGSVIISSLFGTATTFAVTGFLPLDGKEFSILAIIILILSIYFVIKKIRAPLTCPID